MLQATPTTSNVAEKCKELILPTIPSTTKTENAIDNDKINLRLILVSGRIMEYQFLPTFTAGEVVENAFKTWPAEWDDEKVSSPTLLKLIYHGRFIHGTVCLQALTLPLGKTTVMHLVTRENLPEPNSSDSLKKSKRGSSCCRCSIF
uniref:Rad60-SLD_2 domain-containing protein n=1 Tax=Rhabditophanes sp. KR3021 TaxID=114890 RepID=A0AC35TIV8_9BILA